MRTIALLLSLALLAGLLINDTAPARTVTATVTAADRHGTALAVALVAAAVVAVVRAGRARWVVPA